MFICVYFCTLMQNLWKREELFESIQVRVELKVRPVFLTLSFCDALRFIVCINFYMW
jgi:hypothetical protein